MTDAQSRLFSLLAAVGIGVWVAALVAAAIGAYLAGWQGLVAALMWLGVAQIVFTVTLTGLLTHRLGSSPALSAWEYGNVQRLRTSRPWLYRVASVRTHVSTMHGSVSWPLSFANPFVVFLLGRRLPPHVRWQPGRVVGALLPAGSLNHLLVASVALAVFWIGHRVPLARTPAMLLLAIYWVMTVCDLAAGLIPTLGLRAVVFISRWPPAVVMVALLLCQGLALGVTSRSLLILLDAPATMVAAWLAPFDLFAVRDTISSPTGMFALYAQDPRLLITPIGVGLWYAALAGTTVALIFERRTDTEAVETVAVLLLCQLPGPAGRAAATITEPRWRLRWMAVSALAAGDRTEAQRLIRAMPTSTHDLARVDPDIELLNCAEYIAGYPAYSALLQEWLGGDPDQRRMLIVTLTASPYFSDDQTQALLRRAATLSYDAVTGHFAVKSVLSPIAPLSDTVCSVSPALHLYTSLGQWCSVALNAQALGTTHSDAAPSLLPILQRHAIALSVDRMSTRLVRRRVLRSGDTAELLILIHVHLLAAVVFSAMPGGAKRTRRRLGIIARLAGRRLQSLIPNDPSVTDLDAFVASILGALDKELEVAATQSAAMAALTIDSVAKRPDLLAHRVVAFAQARTTETGRDASPPPLTTSG